MDRDARRAFMRRAGHQRALSARCTDAQIRSAADAGKTPEAILYDLALDDLTRAADLFRPVYDRTAGVDGYVSLEVSPLLA